MFSGEVVKVNKNRRHQKRNIILTTESLYNVREDNFLTKTLGVFDKNALVKRRISLTQVKSIVYARLGNEFVVNVPDEFDYRIVSPHKDLLVEYLMFGLKNLGVKEVLFYFTDEVELFEFCTHRSEKKKGITRPPTGESSMYSYERFREFLDEKDIERKEVYEQTETIIGTKKKITINDFDLLKT